MSILLRNLSNDCESPTYSSGSTGDMEKTCAYIIVDLNGLKPPNAYGRDIFYFYVTSKRGPLLYPLGGVDDALDGW